MRPTIATFLLAFALPACGADQPVGTEAQSQDQTPAQALYRHDHHDHDHDGDVPPPGPDDVSEAVFFKGARCHMVFRNVSSPEAETFFIWNLGVDGIVDGAAYPTDRRANLYAVFAPAPAGSTHHVDGEDDFDHYHIVDAAPERGGRYDGTWDVFLVFPGPNFDAATYRAARTVHEMEKQIRAGILGPVTTTTDAGFGPLVLHAEIFDECR